MVRFRGEFAARARIRSRVWPVVLVLALGQAFGCVEQGASADSTGGTAPPSRELRFVRRVPEHGPPEAFTLHADSYLEPRHFIEHVAPSLWGLSKLDELRLVNTLNDSNGYAHEHYQQFHAGYRVLDAHLALSLARHGKVVSAVGKPRGGLEGISTEVRVSESSAVERARQRAVSACSLIHPATFLKTPPPRLLVPQRYDRVVWQATAVVLGPEWVEWTVQIDSKSGELLLEWGGQGLGGRMPGCSSGN